MPKNCKVLESPERCKWTPKYQALFWDKTKPGFIAGRKTLDSWVAHVRHEYKQLTVWVRYSKENINGLENKHDSPSHNSITCEMSWMRAALLAVEDFPRSYLPQKCQLLNTCKLTWLDKCRTTQLFLDLYYSAMERLSGSREYQTYLFPTAFCRHFRISPPALLLFLWVFS